MGFGEAGAEVIADNIRSGGDLNPMVPGRKVAAIFGFCDIRSFTGEGHCGSAVDGNAIRYLLRWR